MSTVRANAILDSSGGNTATINGVPLRQGVLDPENRIINGAFDFWQRGTSQTSVDVTASADRFLNGGSGGTVTMSRQSFAPGDILGSNNPTYFLRQTVSGQTLASHRAEVVQRIEDVRSYAGQTITFLGWARRSSGSGNMAIEFWQSFGTGGTPSADVTGTGQLVTLSGSWAPFAVTTAVPSIAGKTIGSDGNSYLAFEIWTSAGSNFNTRAASIGLQTIGVDLWGLHIKLGTHSTAAVDLYKAPELGPELYRCQRYYQAGVVRWDGQATNAVPFTAPVYFPQTMRAPPIITESNISNTLFPASVTGNNITVNGYFSTRTANGTGAGNFASNYTANAEI